MKHVLFLSSLILLSCQSQKQSPAPPTATPSSQDAPKQDSEVCIAFDQRQCGGDEFASYLPNDRNTDEMFAGMTEFLRNASITVLHLRIDMNFYEMVCGACDVCPEQHRFFLSLPGTELSILKNMNLMNMEPVDCAEYF